MTDANQPAGALRCCDTLWCFDSDTNTLYGPESQHPLPPKHGMLLRYLVENQHRYVNLEEIHNEVWRGRVVSDAAVRKVIVDLKRYLKAKDNTDIIENRRALGYRLNMPMAMKMTEEEPGGHLHTRVQLDPDKLDYNVARLLLQEQRKLLAEHMKTLELLEHYLDEHSANGKPTPT